MQLVHKCALNHISKPRRTPSGLYSTSILTVVHGQRDRGDLLLPSSSSSCGGGGAMRRGTTTTALRTEAVLRRLSTEGTATTRGRRRPLRSVVLLTREWLRGGGGSGGGGLGGRGVSSQEESWKGVENFRGSLCKERKKSTSLFGKKGPVDSPSVSTTATTTTPWPERPSRA